MNSKIIALYLKVSTERSSALLRTLYHATQCSIQAHGELTSHHLQQLVAWWNNNIDGRFARRLDIHDLLQVIEQETLHSQKA
jgi:transposase-like protein